MKYNWNLSDDNLELDGESVEQPIVEDEYIAVKGINHKGLGLRVNPGELVPEALKTIKAFNMWIKDGAIKKVGG